MDKITHQVRAEHWTKIMNECINSGRSKTVWCRAMESQKSSSSIGRGFWEGKLLRILRIHHCR